MAQKGQQQQRFVKENLQTCCNSASPNLQNHLPLRPVSSANSITRQTATRNAELVCLES